jgi:Putative beta-barrel porin 2
MLLGGTAGLFRPQLAASTNPESPWVDTSGSNFWVEPGPLAPAQGSQSAPATESATSARQSGDPSAVAVEGPEVDINGAKQSIGRPVVVPIVQIRTTYDDNIFYNPTDKKADVYTTMVAGLAVGWGEFRDQITPLGSFQEIYDQLRTPDFDSRQFFYASYTPGYTAFAENGREDTLDQNANLGTKWLFGGLTCDLRANYRLFSEALADTGTRIRQGQFGIALNSQYEFSNRTSVEADLNFITHHFRENFLVNSTEWIDRNYLNYQVFPKTNISAGATLGYVAADSGPDQTYEQALGRVVYNTDRRISANISGGIEFRQFAGVVADVTNPVFSATLNYSPFDGTNITVAGSRFVTNSVEYIGQDIVATKVSVACTQQLFDKVALSIEGAYGTSDYGDNGGAGDIHRNDDGFGFQGSISFHVTADLAVNLLYEYGHNLSTLERYTFVDNRAVVDLDLLF